MQYDGDKNVEEFSTLENTHKKVAQLYNHILGFRKYFKYLTLFFFIFILFNYFMYSSTLCCQTLASNNFFHFTHINILL